MAVAIPIIIIVVVGIATVIVLAANRQPAATGRLSPRARRARLLERARGRDVGSVGVHGARDRRAQRADDTRATYESVPAKPRAAATSHGGSRSTRKSSGSTPPVPQPRAAHDGGVLGVGVRRGMPRVPLAAPARAGSAARSPRARPPTWSATISRTAAPFYIPEARAYVRAVPAEDLPAAKKVYSPIGLLGHGRVRRALPAVRAPRLSRAVVPDVAVVRVPVPRLEVQPGRREEGGPDASRSRPVPDPHRRRGDMTINTGDIELGPPIGTNTTGQQQEGPLCV